MFGDLFVLAEQPQGTVGTMTLCPMCGLYSGRAEHTVEHLNARHATPGMRWESSIAAHFQSGREFIIARRVQDLVKPPAPAPKRKAIDPRMLRRLDQDLHVGPPAGTAIRETPKPAAKLKFKPAPIAEPAPPTSKKKSKRNPKSE